MVRGITCGPRSPDSPFRPGLPGCPCERDEKLAMLKDTPKSDLKALLRCKITSDLVPFQNSPYPHIQLKNPLPQHPTHSPRVRGGLCIPWVQGVHEVPARGAGDTAELRRGSWRTPNPSIPSRSALPLPILVPLPYILPNLPLSPSGTNPDFPLPCIHSNQRFPPLLQSSLPYHPPPPPRSLPALLTRACCRIAWA